MTPHLAGLLVTSGQSARLVPIGTNVPAQQTRVVRHVLHARMHLTVAHEADVLTAPRLATTDRVLPTVRRGFLRRRCPKGSSSPTSIEMLVGVCVP
ncbi:hypothetical protein [Sanguibacter antarcticus]|uniref:hypothetical protein n=1 Tax=Sanguibacter antarcticus TaxID=372484 RepID=UPI000BF90880|nr:hypothetical protein [Sanguibacter antarcticus]